MYIRPPAVAGRFYPESPQKLQFAVSALLEEALPAHSEAPVALIAPHAGYLFSGQIAADAFKQAHGHLYDLVVIFGTNHTSRRLDHIALPSSSAFATPLGNTTIPRNLVAELLRDIPECIEDDHPHEFEHSIEVQIPFLQQVAPDVPILPMIVGLGSPKRCHDFGMKLAVQLDDRRVLYVASSDLSHYPTKEMAERLDKEVIQGIISLDSSRLNSVFQNHPAVNGEAILTRACGSGPINALIGVASALGCSQGVEISYANSGDTLFGEDERVVGYGAIAFYKGAEIAAVKSQPDKPLGPSLIQLARRSLEMYLGGDVTPLPRGFSKEGLAQRGAFVTLYNGKKLRGCVGHITSDEPLCLTVGKMALAAASKDWRFPPVTYKEIQNLIIEVSVLTEPELIAGIDEIEPGRDGVMIRKGGRKGVFLPKVAEEQGWDKEELLEHLCDKADLPRGSWRKGAELLTFQAEIYKE